MFNRKNTLKIKKIFDRKSAHYKAKSAVVIDKDIDCNRNNDQTAVKEDMEENVNDKLLHSDCAFTRVNIFFPSLNLTDGILPLCKIG